MKELFNTLSNVSNFFQERRLVYDELRSKSKPVSDAEDPDETPQQRLERIKKQKKGLKATDFKSVRISADVAINRRWGRCHNRSSSARSARDGIL